MKQSKVIVIQGGRASGKTQLARKIANKKLGGNFIETQEINSRNKDWYNYKNIIFDMSITDNGLTDLDYFLMLQNHLTIRKPFSKTPERTKKPNLILVVSHLNSCVVKLLTIHTKSFKVINVK